jgi:hypothetical protein
LSQYFSDAGDFATSANATPSVSFFDQLSPSAFEQNSPTSNFEQSSPTSNFEQISAEQESNFDERGEDVAEDMENRETAVLHSCRESRIDLPTMAVSQQHVVASHSEAKLDVAEQTFDDARSLQRRQSHEGRHNMSASEPHALSTQEATVVSDNESSPPSICNLFATSNISDPFDTILSEQKSGNIENRTEHPTSLPTISEPYLVNSTPASHPGSVYGTPNGPTPSGDFAFSVQTSTPLPSQTAPPPNLSPFPMAPPMSTPTKNLTPFQSGVPITSPLPSFGLSPAVALPPTISNLHESVNSDDEMLPQEVLRRRDAWIPSPSTQRVIDSVR